MVCTATLLLQRRTLGMTRFLLLILYQSRKDGTMFPL
jgi:hypothetical protein